MSRLTLKEKISYGLGDFGNGFMFDLGQAYLLIFYTDVAGLPGAVAGGVFLFTKIFDAFMDPIAGYLRRRPQPDRAVRSVPAGDDVLVDRARRADGVHVPHPGIHARASNLVYAYASYMAWGVLYSFTNVPYGSLGSVMTQESTERAKLASFRQAGSVGALLVTGVAFMPIVHAFESDRIGFPVAAGVDGARRRPRLLRRLPRHAGARPGGPDARQGDPAGLRHDDRLQPSAAGADPHDGVLDLGLQHQDRDGRVLHPVLPARRERAALRQLHRDRRLDHRHRVDAGAGASGSARRTPRSAGSCSPGPRTG